MDADKPYTITSLSEQEKRSWRTSIFVDGCFWRAIETEVVAELGLSVGQKLTHDELAGLGDELEKKRAMRRAFNLLSHRARSTAELSDRLKRAGFEPHIISAALKRLHELGYLNDEEFASAWLKDRMHVKRYGKQRVRYELKSKGISDSVIDKLLGTHTSDTSEYERAFELAEEKVLTYKDCDADKSYRRLSQFLVRRGFSAATAYDVCRDIFRADSR